MKKVLVISYNMVSHLYATAKLARLLNNQEGYSVTYGCPDHAPSIALVQTLLPKEVEIITVGASLTKKQMNERVVTDPLSWQTLWKALRKPFPLAEGVNSLFDEQEEMYEPIKELIRTGEYDCVVGVHSACTTVGDAVESLQTEGVNAPPYVTLSSLPYDPALYVDEWKFWTEPRNMTTFPHVSYYPKEPTSFLSGVVMRFWQALDTFLTWRAWKNSETRCNERREERGLPPAKGQFLYYLRNFPCISFGGAAPFGDYRNIPSNVTCIGSLDVPEDDQPISESLQGWLDDAKEEGVIYVGFGTGTIVNEKEAKAFTGSLLENLQANSDVTPRILWALRSVEIARLESFITESLGQEPTLRTKTRLEYGTKVRIESDLPQSTLLQSPQVKLFISHMGMGGFVEGVAAEVPFLCYPSGCDQYYNARRAMEAGIAERITDLDQIPEQVQRLWENDEVKKNCQASAQALLATRGNERAAGVIEDLIEQHRTEGEETSKPTTSATSCFEAVVSKETSEKTNSCTKSCCDTPISKVEANTLTSRAA